MSDLFSLQGKVAIVTGGSQGIGLMITRGLVDAGAKVYVSSRKKEVCDAIAAELSEHGDCVSLPGDVSTEETVLELVGQLAEREDKLHVLVNNAATAWAAPLETYPEAAWNKVFGMNVTSAFNLSRAVLPMLERSAAPRDPGRIINVGSIDGFRVPELENYAYSASKAAMHQMTRVLAQRLASRNVTVNAIAPGPFPSKMMATTLNEVGEEWRAKCPMGRLGEPDDMAGIAVYLASRAAAYVTGQIIAVDGGFSTTPW